MAVEPSSMKETLKLLLLLFPLCFEVSADSSNCTLPAVKGPCEAHMPRFFYNATSSQCEKFVYGGCGGNANNFYSLSECLRECKNESICTLPPVSGPCEAYSEQFYYNASTAKCEKLIYGGCGGNLNRFPTFFQCMMECGAPSLCNLPASPGPCEAHMPSYFFNSSSAKCEKFNYGGCEGNSNRFATVARCRGTCPDLCTFPAVVGLCKAHFPRYYYNFEVGRCEKFVYGGCGGNANRFESESECIATCSGNANVGSLVIGTICFLAMVLITYK